MLLSKCRKGQSLEKVEKLCRTATACNNFPTQSNNSHHTCATRIGGASSLHLRMRRTIEVNNVSANGAARRTRASRFVSSIACSDRGDCGLGHVKKRDVRPSPWVPSPPGPRNARPDDRLRGGLEGRRPGSRSGAVHPSRLAELAPQDDGAKHAARSNERGARSNAAPPIA